MPPVPGRPWEKSVESIRSVPREPGVYWLRSVDDIVYIGESNDLQRRLREHFRRKEFDRFQFDTLDGYCKRYGISRPPWMAPKVLCYKIENTEFRAHQEKFGTLPELNKQNNHYEDGILESAYDEILRRGNRWLGSGNWF